MITVGEALDHYKSNVTDIADPDRLDAAISNLNTFMEDDFLSSVDVHKCKDYADDRRSVKVKRHGEFHYTADSTIARELGVLKAAANDALKWKQITLDQMPTFEIPKNLPKRVVWLLDGELRHLFVTAKCMDDTLYMFVRLLYVTGSRRQAIESLEWTQVNLNNNIIHLSKPGEKKTKKRRPSVPISNDIADALREFHTFGKTKYVLDHNRERYRAFIKLCERADLLDLPEHDGRPAGRMTPHVIRHTRATHLLENGMTPYAVGKLLGDTAATVERVYGHACMSKLSDDIERYS